MVPTLSPCRWAKATRSGSRAMVPSSFMISQITPDGLRPARRAMSTAASVWPARTSTPPSRAIRGKMWPGVTTSLRPSDGSMATAMVRARSAAEMPVVTPSRASIEWVKAVLRRLSSPWAISGRPSSVAALAGQGQADQAAAVLGHEVDGSGVAELGRDDEVALVLAVLVVDQHEHAAGAGVLDQLVGRGEDRPRPLAPTRRKALTLKAGLRTRGGGRRSGPACRPRG